MARLTLGLILGLVSWGGGGGGPGCVVRLAVVGVDVAELALRRVSSSALKNQTLHIRHQVFNTFTLSFNFTRSVHVHEKQSTALAAEKVKKNVFLEQVFAKAIWGRVT